GGLPDGGTFHLNRDPRFNHNIPFVDLDTAFSTFGPKTQQGLRHAVAAIGDSVAGRGSQFNEATYSLRQLIGPLDNLLRLLSSPPPPRSSTASSPPPPCWCPRLSGWTSSSAALPRCSRAPRDWPPPSRTRSPLSTPWRARRRPRRRSRSSAATTWPRLAPPRS